ncbi:Sensor histidine kinase RcsC [Methylobacterium adhaesivum]|jgi:CheY-like chemotaxis protein|uniref:Response regulator n=1 Tax=Methylobacterium adhaesivum TaxID=333297 RepID=A0ABT8BGN8_9HYPH|nr:response regulator [Methylobacterium adhaesivum]MDN3591226.1 response regulator [Methylobacterium adhaesivum]GJD30894.1 Sensor histidine kinase RcsC [Methylobacterium adhaesivum]
MSAAPSLDARPVILVVEDEPDERYLAAEMLEETGFRVLEAETAERALAILKDRGEEVSVVFSDVRTPGPIGGFELARIIGVTWPRVRVLLTSGDAGDQPSDLRMSATFIPKPWRAADILAWVQEAAGRSAQAHAGPDVIGVGVPATKIIVGEVET